MLALKFPDIIISFLSISEENKASKDQDEGADSSSQSFDLPLYHVQRYHMVSSSPSHWDTFVYLS